MTFAPNPTARPTTREGRLAKVFTDSVWIDEALREVTDVRAVAWGVWRGVGMAARSVVAEPQPAAHDAGLPTGYPFLDRVLPRLRNDNA